MIHYTVPPSAPESLQLDSVGNTWIAFHWTQIQNEVKVARQIISASGGGMQWEITVDSDQTTVNVTNLNPGTEYIFRIIAVGIDGQLSPRSSPLTTTTHSIG